MTNCKLNRSSRFSVKKKKIEYSRISKQIEVREEQRNFQLDKLKMIMSWEEEFGAFDYEKKK